MVDGDGSDGDDENGGTGGDCSDGDRIGGVDGGMDTMHLGNICLIRIRINTRQQ